MWNNQITYSAGVVSGIRSNTFDFSDIGLSLYLRRLPFVVFKCFQVKCMLSFCFCPVHHFLSVHSGLDGVPVSFCSLLVYFLSLNIGKLNKIEEKNFVFVLSVRVCVTLRRIHFFSCRDPEEGPDFFILM